jgi:hypothetical protein
LFIKLVVWYEKPVTYKIIFFDGILESLNDKIDAI